jgi:dolichyl-phosphate beta-glucosyltransferase
MNKIRLSVVIPAYNESKNLKSGTLEEVHEYLIKQKFSYEVLIVDDGSSDNTADLIEEIIKGKPNFKLIRNHHGGKAKTVMSGILKAEGEIVVFTDMDQATPLNQIEKFFPKLDEDFDIVIGSRQGRKGAPFIRKFAAWGFSVLRGIILGLPFKDTQCGFKAFNQKSIQRIIPQIEHEWGTLHTKGGAVNAGFDVEVLYLARKYGFKITEVQVEWNYVDTERVQMLKDALATIYDMFRIKWNDFRGKY